MTARTVRRADNARLAPAAKRVPLAKPVSADKRRDAALAVAARAVDAVECRELLLMLGLIEAPAGTAGAR